MANLAWDATQLGVKTKFDASTRPNCQIIAPTSPVITAAFTAIVIGWEWQPPIDDRMVFKGRFKITGGVTVT